MLPTPLVTTPVCLSAESRATSTSFLDTCSCTTRPLARTAVGFNVTLRATISDIDNEPQFFQSAFAGAAPGDLLIFSRGASLYRLY